MGQTYGERMTETEVEDQWILENSESAYFRYHERIQIILKQTGPFLARISNMALTLSESLMRKN